MKIESISFGISDAELINREITPFMDGMTEVTTPSEDADLLIVWLSGEESVTFLEQTLLPENPVKLFIVHTLIGTVIPFLKLADYIFYMANGQKEIVEMVLDLKFRSESITFPGNEIVIPENRNNGFVYLPNDFNEERITAFVDSLRVSREWYEGKTETLNILFNVPTEVRSAYESFIAEYCEGLSCHTIQDSSRESIREMIASSSYADVFIEEINHDQLKEYIDAKHTSVLYMPNATNWIIEEIARAKAEVYNDYNGLSRSLIIDGHDSISYEQFAGQIKNIMVDVAPLLAEEKKANQAETEVDTVDTINIAAGTQLTNDYVYSICFRNQEDKIVRALDSILAQNGDIDYGIAIVDDCSTDESSKVILERLKDCGVDFTLVQNKKRRFASRNFYNIINLIASNRDSVLIELDGDDYLADNDVLISVDEAYKAGAQKTNGSFTVYPDMKSQTAQDIFSKHSDMDYARPWNLNMCNSWLPLRSTKVGILKDITLDYFVDRHSNNWLPDRHDAITQSRAIEIAGPDNCTFIDRPLYVYDLSGEDHDHGDHESYDKMDHLITLYRNLDRFNRGYQL